MIFREFFTDTEISTYSVLAIGVRTIKSQEDFDAFVDEIAGTIADAEPKDVARFILLGVVMGAHFVAKVVEENQRATNN